MSWQRLQIHLSRWLIAYAVGSMALGLMIGYRAEAWSTANLGTLNVLLTAMVFAVVYPMMVNLKLESLAKAARNWRALALALGYSFLWAPAIGYLLSRTFLPDGQLALGFMLVMVVPCSSMSVSYTGFTKGNIELATLIVAASFLVAVVAVPGWMSLFASRYHVPIPVGEMLRTVVTVLVAPMILGAITRLGLEHRLGIEGFKRLQPVFPTISMISMLILVGLIFFAKAGLILDRWSMVLLIVVPSALYVILSLGLETWINRRLGFSYRDHMAIVFAASSSNNSTAIAIATLAFSPLVAVPAATAPIAQTLLMLLYVRLAPRVRQFFGESESTPSLQGERVAEMTPPSSGIQSSELPVPTLTGEESSDSDSVRGASA
jgi:ACR3 family arsenite efflux pump ArsB